jgi:hypothetical protein
MTSGVGLGWVAVRTALSALVSSSSVPPPAASSPPNLPPLSPIESKILPLLQCIYEDRRPLEAQHRRLDADACDTVLQLVKKGDELSWTVRMALGWALERSVVSVGQHMSAPSSLFHSLLDLALVHTRHMSIQVRWNALWVAGVLVRSDVCASQLSGRNSAALLSPNDKSPSNILKLIKDYIPNEPILRWGVLYVMESLCVAAGEALFPPLSNDATSAATSTAASGSPATMAQAVQNQVHTLDAIFKTLKPFFALDAFKEAGFEGRVLPPLSYQAAQAVSVVSALAQHCISGVTHPTVTQHFLSFFVSKDILLGIVACKFVFDTQVNADQGRSASAMWRESWDALVLPPTPSSLALQRGGLAQVYGGLLSRIALSKLHLPKAGSKLNSADLVSVFQEILLSPVLELLAVKPTPALVRSSCVALTSAISSALSGLGIPLLEKNLSSLIKFLLADAPQAIELAVLPSQQSKLAQRNAAPLSTLLQWMGNNDSTAPEIDAVWTSFRRVWRRSIAERLVVPSAPSALTSLRTLIQLLQSLLQEPRTAASALTCVAEELLFGVSAMDDVVEQDADLFVDVMKLFLHAADDTKGHACAASLMNTLHILGRHRDDAFGTLDSLVGLIQPGTPSDLISLSFYAVASSRLPGLGDSLVGESWSMADSVLSRVNALSARSDSPSLHPDQASAPLLLASVCCLVSREYLSRHSAEFQLYLEGEVAACVGSQKALQDPVSARCWALGRSFCLLVLSLYLSRGLTAEQRADTSNSFVSLAVSISTGILGNLASSLSQQKNSSSGITSSLWLFLLRGLLGIGNGLCAHLPPQWMPQLCQVASLVLADTPTQITPTESMPQSLQHLLSRLFLLSSPSSASLSLQKMQGLCSIDSLNVEAISRFGFPELLSTQAEDVQFAALQTLITSALPTSKPPTQPPLFLLQLLKVVCEFHASAFADDALPQTNSAPYSSGHPELSLNAFLTPAETSIRGLVVGSPPTLETKHYAVLSPDSISLIANFAIPTMWLSDSHCRETADILACLASIDDSLHAATVKKLIGIVRDGKIDSTSNPTWILARIMKYVGATRCRPYFAEVVRTVSSRSRDLLYACCNDAWQLAFAKASKLSDLLALEMSCGSLVSFLEFLREAYFCAGSAASPALAIDLIALMSRTLLHGSERTAVANATTMAALIVDVVSACSQAVGPEIQMYSSTVDEISQFLHFYDACILSQTGGSGLLQDSVSVKSRCVSMASISGPQQLFKWRRDSGGCRPEMVCAYLSLLEQLLLFAPASCLGPTAPVDVHKLSSQLMRTAAAIGSSSSENNVIRFPTAVRSKAVEVLRLLLPLHPSGIDSSLNAFSFLLVLRDHETSGPIRLAWASLVRSLVPLLSSFKSDPFPVYLRLVSRVDAPNEPNATQQPLNTPSEEAGDEDAESAGGLTQSSSDGVSAAEFSRREESVGAEEDMCQWSPSSELLLLVLELTESTLLAKIEPIGPYQVDLIMQLVFRALNCGRWRCQTRALKLLSSLFSIAGSIQDPNPEFNGSLLLELYSAQTTTSIRQLLLSEAPAPSSLRLSSTLLSFLTHYLTWLRKVAEKNNASIIVACKPILQPLILLSTSLQRLDSAFSDCSFDWLLSLSHGMRLSSALTSTTSGAAESWCKSLLLSTLPAAQYIVHGFSTMLARFNTIPSWSGCTSQLATLIGAAGDFVAWTESSGASIKDVDTLVSACLGSITKIARSEEFPDLLVAISGIHGLVANCLRRNSAVSDLVRLLRSCFDVITHFAPVAPSLASSCCACVSAACQLIQVTDQGRNELSSLLSRAVSMVAPKFDNTQLLSCLSSLASISEANLAQSPQLVDAIDVVTGLCVRANLFAGQPHFTSNPMLVERGFLSCLAALRLTSSAAEGLLLLQHITSFGKALHERSPMWFAAARAINHFMEPNSAHVSLSARLLFDLVVIAPHGVLPTLLSSTISPMLSCIEAPAIPSDCVGYIVAILLRTPNNIIASEVVVCALVKSFLTQKSTDSRRHLAAALLHFGKTNSLLFKSCISLLNAADLHQVQTSLAQLVQNAHPGPPTTTNSSKITIDMSKY